MSEIITDTRVDIGLGVHHQQIIMKINENITNQNVMQILMNYLVNPWGSITGVNHYSKRILVMMKGIRYLVNNTESPEAGVHLNHQ